MGLMRYWESNATVEVKKLRISVSSGVLVVKDSSEESRFSKQIWKLAVPVTDHSFRAQSSAFPRLCITPKLVAERQIIELTRMVKETMKTSGTELLSQTDFNFKRQ